MNKIENFDIVQPKKVPDEAGVFAIARYTSKASTDFEILHCGESENIKTSASQIMAEQKFDGFDRSIIYLVRLEPDPGKRSELLQLLLSDCNQDK